MDEDHDPPLRTQGTHERLSAQRKLALLEMRTALSLTPRIKILARSPREPLLPMVWKIAMRDPSGDSFHWPVLPLRTRPSGGSLGRPCPRRRGVLIEYSLPLSSYLRVMVVFISW